MGKVWLNDDPNRKDSASVGCVDIRHTDTVNFPDLDAYNDLLPKDYKSLEVKARIHHVLSFPGGRKFMASLSSCWTGRNGRTHDSYESALAELSVFVKEYLQEAENV